MQEVSADTHSYLSSTLERFSPGLRAAYAYGSGVFKQANHASVTDNMIDLIFVVDDARNWHEQNLRKHRKHYSLLGALGPRAIQFVQCNLGARVYFNTNVNMDDRLIKYGVIDSSSFLRDLLSWESMYIAGRLQKPVLQLSGHTDREIKRAFTANLQSALDVSLLALPEKFAREDLFTQIASLSYKGDPRMIVGEDKGKVSNIVKPGLARFEQLYESAIAKSKLHANGESLEQDMSLHRGLVRQLPKLLKKRALKRMGYPTELLVDVPDEEIDSHIADLWSRDEAECRKHVQEAVPTLVRRSSTTQTLKNAFTAGPVKSVTYFARKCVKMVKGMAR